jgi:hypothetical protein
LRIGKIFAEQLEVKRQRANPVLDLVYKPPGQLREFGVLLSRWLIVSRRA